MTKVKAQLRTNLKGLKKFAWSKNLKGWFVCNGRELTDAEVRKIVEYGISKGYECDIDIPDDEVEEVLNWNKK